MNEEEEEKEEENGGGGGVTHQLNRTLHTSNYNMEKEQKSY